MWATLLTPGPAGAVEIIAHRGASHDAPENTLAAIDLAWKQGADAVEFDVHLSKDGRIVVMHDADVKRTAGVPGKIAEMTLAELRRLDVGSWKDKRFAGEKAPTLAEVLARVPESKRALIEVKCGPEIVGQLQRVVKASKLKPEQTAVISFKAEVVTAVKKAMPELAVYWLVDPKPDKCPVWTAEALLDKARQIKADALDLSVQPLLTDGFLRQASAAKLPVYAWTIDDVAIAKRLIAAGAVGITTNRPEWLRQQLGK